MKKIKKGMALILGLMVSALLLTGCGQKSNEIPWLNSDGTIRTLTKEELSKSGAYYIKHGEEYYRLYPHGLTKMGNNNIIWYTSNYETYYPKMQKGDELIYINAGARPTITEFQFYEDCGYTIGMQFSIVNNDKQEQEISLTENFCPDSPIKTYIDSSIYNKGDVSILKINNKKFTPSKLDDMGFIHNLTKNAMYKLTYYMGTLYRSVNVKADTHVYKQIASLETNSYKANEDVYFTVILPENMPNGIYSVDNNYWFEYNDVDNKSDPEGLMNSIAEKYAKENEEENTDGSETTTEPNEEYTPVESDTSSIEDSSDETPSETTTFPEENNTTTVPDQTSETTPESLNTDNE